MALKGIDVSSWNGSPFNAKTEAAFKKSDFVIAKATQGTNYVSPACDYAVQRAIKAKKLFGVYHYATGGNAKNEAAYFAKNVKGYLKKGIMCLDWESGDNPAFGNGSWVTTFVKEFYRRTKIYPVIYVQASAVNQIPAYVVKRCALWLAGYPENKDSWAVPKFSYSTGRWSACSIWQFSSGGGIDRNIAYITASGWNKIAGKNSYKDAKGNTVYISPRKMVNKLPISVYRMKDGKKVLIKTKKANTTWHVVKLGAKKVWVKTKSGCYLHYKELTDK